MRKVHKKKKLSNDPENELKIGEGFNDIRGEIPDKGPIPKHNGQNINNEALGYEEREKEKASRR